MSGSTVSSGVPFSACPGQVVNLAGYLQCLVPKYAWSSFYRSRDERLSWPCRIEPWTYGAAVLHFIYYTTGVPFIKPIAHYYYESRSQNQKSRTHESCTKEQPMKRYAGGVKQWECQSGKKC